MAGIRQKSYVTLFPFLYFKKIDVKQQETYKKIKGSNTDILLMLLLLEMIKMMIMLLLALLLLLLLLLPLIKVIIIIIILIIIMNNKKNNNKNQKWLCIKRKEIAMYIVRLIIFYVTFM